MDYKIKRLVKIIKPLINYIRLKKKQLTVVTGLCKILRYKDKGVLEDYF